MTKTQKIIYWISTLWLSLGMVATGIVQIAKSEKERNFLIFSGACHFDYHLNLLLKSLPELEHCIMHHF
jgi:hypothetical protein